jgi:hypothetical protein
MAGTPRTLSYEDAYGIQEQPTANAPRTLSYEDAYGVEPESRSFGDVASDVGVTALKGAVALPQAIVGLADIPTGGNVGKTLEEIGYRPGETQKTLETWYSPAQQEANRKVHDAKGFVDTLQAAIENPSVIATTAGESLPQMLGGAGVARGLMKAGQVAGKVVSPLVAGAIGEGVIGAGSAEESIRGQTVDGLTTPKQSLTAVASGIGTAALGALGGKISQRLGLADIDTMLAQGGANAATAAAAKAGFVKQILGSGISEGVFEELPQSVQEQMWQNFALGKPLTDGVGNAAALGLLTGTAMGAAGGGYNAMIGRVAPDTTQPNPDIAAQTTLDGAIAAANAATAPNVQPKGDIVTEINQNSDEELLNQINNRPVDQAYVPQPKTEPRPTINITPDVAQTPIIEQSQPTDLGSQIAVDPAQQAAPQPTEGQNVQDIIPETQSQPIELAPQTSSAVGNNQEQVANNDVRTEVKEAPIVRYRKIASEIEAALPPIADGATRLWRGNRPGEIGKNPQFTNSLAGIALPFKDAYKGELSYVDIPTDDLSKYEAKGAAAPGAEFILPSELAAQAVDTSKNSSSTTSSTLPSELTTTPQAAPTTDNSLAEELKPLRTEILKYKGEGKTVTGTKTIYDATDRLKAIAEDPETSLKAQQVWFNSKRKTLEKNGDTEAAALFEKIAAHLKERIKTANEPAPVNLDKAAMQVASDVVENAAKVITPKPKRKVGIPKTMSMLQFVASIGGFNRANISKEIGLLDDMKRHKSGIFGSPAFRVNGGMAWDRVGEALAEAGYLPKNEHGQYDKSDLEDRIRAELSGDKQYRVDDVIDNAEAGKATRELDELRDEAESVGVDWKKYKKIDDLWLAIDAKKFELSDAAEAIAEEALSRDDVDTDFDFGTPVSAAETEAWLNGVDNGQGHQGQVNGTAAGNAGENNQRDPQRGSTQGEAQQQTPDREFALTSQTEEELRQQEARAADTSIEDRAAADRASEVPLTLSTQSSSNTGSAANQGGMFTPDGRASKAAEAKPDPLSQMAASVESLAKSVQTLVDSQSKPARTGKIGDGAKQSTLEKYLAESPEDKNKLSATVTLKNSGSEEVRGSLHSIIENAFKDGYRVVLTKSGPAFVNEKMRGYSEREISPAGMRYANWLDSNENNDVTEDGFGNIQPSDAQADDVSKKPENIDTSKEPVRAIDTSPERVKGSGESGQGEDSGGIKFSKAGNKKTLIIQHNLSEENLLHADRMGGIPVPSLAITQAEHPLESFGEITLVGGVDMANPKGYAATKVYGADIYSPRYPTVTHIVKSSDTSELQNKLKQFVVATDSGGIYADDIRTEGKKAISEHSAIMAKFLTDNNITPEIKHKDEPKLADHLEQFKDDTRLVYELADAQDFRDAVIDHHKKELHRIYDKIKKGWGAEKIAEQDESGWGRILNSAAHEVNDYQRAMRDAGKADKYKTRTSLNSQIDSAGLRDKYNEYANDVFDSLNPEEKIFQGFTNSGNRKYIPHTLDNVIKILKKEMVGGEGFNYGVGTIRSKFTPKFKSIAEIQKSKDRLLNADAFNDVKGEIDNEFQDLANSMRSHHPIGNDFGFMDTMSSTLYDAATMGLSRAFKENGFTDVTPKMLADSAEFLDKLRTLPTAYFEAKILRAVDLSEFKGAAVPKQTSKKAIDALNRRGITNIKYYDNSVNGDRTKKINELAKESDLLFSKSTQTQNTHTVASATSSMLDAHTGKVKSVLQAMLDNGKVKVVTAEEAAGILNNFPNFEGIQDGRATNVNAPSNFTNANATGKPFDGRLNIPENTELGSGYMDSLADEHSSDSIFMDAKKVANFLESTSFVIKGYGGLSAEARRSVLDQMFLAGKDSEILNSVIRFIPVDMMDVLRAEQITPQMLFHDKAMLLDALSGNGIFSGNVSAMPVANLIRKTTSARAAWIVGHLRGGSKDLNSTVSARDRDLVRKGFANTGNGTKRSSGRVGELFVSTDENLIAVEAGEVHGLDNGRELERSSITRDVQAFFNPFDNTTYFIADNIPASYSPSEWEGLIFHEISTHALSLNRDSKEFKSILKQIEAMRKAGNKTVVAAFKRVPKDTRPENVTEEALAYLLQESPKLGISQRFLAWFRHAIRAIGKSFPTLQKMKLHDWASKLSPEDLRFMAESALKNSERSGVQNESDTPLFSKSSQTDTPAFKKWFGDSKVVDADGKPLVVYHGGTTGENIKPFAGMIWLAENKDYSSSFAEQDGGSVATLFARIKNPLDVSNLKGEKTLSSWRKFLSKNGIDISKVQLEDWAPEYGKYTFFDLLPHAGNNYFNNRNNGLIDEIKNAGFDGIKAPEETTDGIKSGQTYVAFDSANIKPATNFDGSSNNILFSKNPVAEDKAVMGDIANAKNGISSGKPREKKTATEAPVFEDAGHALGFWIKGFGRNQLVSLYQNTVIGKRLKKYKELREQITADTNKLFEKADNFLGDLRSLPTELRTTFADLAHQSTLYNVDPANAKYVPSADAVEMARFLATNPSDKKLADRVKARLSEKEDAHKRLHEMYMALPADKLKSGLTARDLFNGLRQRYVDQTTLMFEAFEGRIDRLEVDVDVKKEAIKELRGQLKTLLGRVYFPLFRSGDFVLNASKSGQEEIIEHHETERERNKQAKILRAQGYTVVASKRVVNSKNQKTVIATGAIKKLIESATENGTLAGDQLKTLLDEIDQTIIKSMPDTAYRRSFIHRKGTAGYSNDFIRAYASSMRRSSAHIANLRHADKIPALIEDMQKTIKSAAKGGDNKTDALDDVVNRVVRIEEEIQLVTSPFAALAGRIGFAQMLGSVSNFILNGTQVAQFTLPHLSGEYGATKTMLQLGKAYAAQTAAMKIPKNIGELGHAIDMRTRLKGDELEVFQRMHDSGKLDLSQTFDLIEAASTASDQISDWQSDVMKFIGLPQHLSEVVNRQVTALAAIRLEMARSKDTDKAYEAAKTAIDDTHFDYSKENRAWIMTGNTARPLLMFKQYAQNYVFTWGNTARLALAGSKIRDSDGNLLDGTRPSERKKARKQLVGLLGVQFLAAGALGLPIFTQSAVVASGMIGFKAGGQKGAFIGVAAAMIAVIASAFGDDDGEDFEVELRRWLAKMLGDNWAEIVSRGVLPRGLASRVDASEPIIRSPETTHNKQKYLLDWMEATLGAFWGGTVVGALSGGFDIKEGEPNGVKKFIPIKQMKDMAEAWRWASDGMADKDKHGTIITKVDKADVFWKAMGVNPSSVVRAQEFNHAKHMLHAALNDKRSKIVDRLVAEKNPAIKFKEMQAYNKDAPLGYAITSQEVSGAVKRDMLTSDKEKKVGNPVQEMYLDKRMKELRSSH